MHQHGIGMRRVHQLAHNLAKKKRIDDIDAQASCFDAKEKNGLVILMHSCTKKI